MKDAAMTGAQAAASDTRAAVPAAAWRMLGLAVAAQAAWSLLVSTPAYLIPLLHLQRGLPLATAGLLAAAPSFGTMLVLVAWGAVTDRYGEPRTGTVPVTPGGRATRTATARSSPVSTYCPRCSWCRSSPCPPSA